MEKSSRAASRWVFPTITCLCKCKSYENTQTNQTNPLLLCDVCYSSTSCQSKHKAASTELCSLRQHKALL
eukprot:6457850-Amphidinium_carterae.2